jgi:hypothetical protein
MHLIDFVWWCLVVQLPIMDDWELRGGVGLRVFLFAYFYECFFP